MKEDLNYFQSQDSKTVCSISGLMVVATITQPLEGKFFANGSNISMGVAALTGTSIAAFLAWFNKSGSDFKDGFEPKEKDEKEKINYII